MAAWFTPVTSDKAILGKPALVTATRDYRVGDETGKRITRDVWYERIVARAKYLLQPRTSMARDGSQQVRCPATGPNPTLACPLRPGASAQPSLMPVARRSLPLVDLRGSVCNNAGGTQVLDGEHWNRHAMGMQFGTDRWARHYTSLRQTVESFNRYVKDSAFVGLANPDRRRVRGFASCFLLVTTLLMAGNTRKASRWLSKPVKVDSRGRGPLKRRADEEATPRRRDLTYGRERRAPGRPPPISPDAPAPLPWVSPAAEPAPQHHRARPKALPRDGQPGPSAALSVAVDVRQVSVRGVSDPSDGVHRPLGLSGTAGPSPRSSFRIKMSEFANQPQAFAVTIGVSMVRGRCR
ncbi:hypothetical protein GCM10025789_31060 [Tessaracoccus lubricantis]|uniref:Uncharacterized protein n=1 Tax=Tessaracoccus lubricantis TaxID=545543 RepID=A0ABP9FP22_9ACTN